MHCTTCPFSKIHEAGIHVLSFSIQMACRQTYVRSFLPVSGIIPMQDHVQYPFWSKRARSNPMCDCVEVAQCINSSSSSTSVSSRKWLCLFHYKPTEIQDHVLSSFPVSKITSILQRSAMFFPYMLQNKRPRWLRSTCNPIRNKKVWNLCRCYDLTRFK